MDFNWPNVQIGHKIANGWLLFLVAIGNDGWWLATMCIVAKSSENVNM